MDTHEWIIGLLTVVFGIAGIVNNNKKKREEQAASTAGRGADAGRVSGTATGRTMASGTGRGAGAGSGSATGAGRAKPFGGSFGSLFEELSRQLAEAEQPSPTVASWPLSRSAESRSWEMAEGVSGHEATSHDYYSLEDEAMNGGYLRGGYAVENVDAESRYAGGELGTGRGGRGSLRVNAGAVVVPAVDPMVDNGAYSEGESSDLSTSGVGAQSSDTGISAGGSSATLNELLGGDFDLRRAVIESEILTPKYIA